MIIQSLKGIFLQLCRRLYPEITTSHRRSAVSSKDLTHYKGMELNDSATARNRQETYQYLATVPSVQMLSKNEDIRTFSLKSDVIANGNSVLKEVTLSVSHPG